MSETAASHADRPHPHSPALRIDRHGCCARHAGARHIEPTALQRIHPFDVVHEAPRTRIHAPQRPRLRQIAVCHQPLGLRQAREQRVARRHISMPNAQRLPNIVEHRAIKQMRY